MLLYSLEQMHRGLLSLWFRTGKDASKEGSRESDHHQFLLSFGNRWIEFPGTVPALQSINVRVRLLRSKRDGRLYIEVFEFVILTQIAFRASTKITNGADIFRQNERTSGNINNQRFWCLPDWELLFVKDNRPRHPQWFQSSDSLLVDIRYTLTVLFREVASSSPARVSAKYQTWGTTEIWSRFYFN